MVRIRVFLIALIFGVFGTSCFKEVDVDKISGDYKDDLGLALPAVRSFFTLKDVVVELSDSVEFYNDADGNRELMRFVHVEEPLIEIDMIDLLDIGVGEFNGAVKIADVDIPEFLTLKDSVTVTDVIDKVDNPIVKSAFELALLGPTAVPDVGGLSIGTYKIWDSEGVNSISFNKGLFEIEVKNEMPVSLDFVATFRDDSGVFLVEKEITGLQQGAVDVFDVDVSGMDLDFPIAVTITQFRAEADGLVQFAADDAIFVFAKLKDVVFNSAELKIKDKIQGIGNDTIAYNDKSKVLTYLKFTSGVLNYKITNESSIDDVDLKLELPEFTKAGNPILINEKLLGNDPASGSIDLSDAVLELSNSDLTHGKTMLNILTDITVHPTDDIITINYNDSINGEFTLTDVKLSAARGWFGQETVDIPEEMTELWLGFFEEDLERITMTNPRFIFTVANSFGIASDIDLQFRGVSEDGTRQVTSVLNTFSIAKPSENSEISTTMVTLDRDSTEGLVDLVNLPPAQVFHSGQILVNPNYNPDDESTIVENYFDSSSRMSLGMRFEVPFELVADSFVYEDTLIYSWPEDTEDLYPRILTITTVHNLPFFIMSEFVFLDKQGLPTDTVFGSLIDAAPYDDDGFSTDSVKSKHEVVLSQTQSEHLKITESIIMKTIIYTGTEEVPREVILQSSDFADVQIGVKAIYNVDDDF